MRWNSLYLFERGGNLVNINKLKNKIIQRDLNISLLAEKIGVDRSTLYRKIKNHGETFTMKEIRLISEELELKEEKVVEIFFETQSH